MTKQEELAAVKAKIKETEAAILQTFSAKRRRDLRRCINRLHSQRIRLEAEIRSGK